SRSASADMLHLMLRQRVNDRLPRLLPDDVQVAHKTGNLPGVVNDVGVLYGPKSTVAVAALVSDTTDETAAATAIAQIGLAAGTQSGDPTSVARATPAHPHASARRGARADGGSCRCCPADVSADGRSNGACHRRGDDRANHRDQCADKRAGHAPTDHTAHLSA